MHFRQRTCTCTCLHTHTSLRGDGGTAQEGKLKIRIENKDAWPMG